MELGKEAFSSWKKENDAHDKSRMRFARMRIFKKTQTILHMSALTISLCLTTAAIVFGLYGDFTTTDAALVISAFLSLYGLLAYQTYRHNEWEKHTGKELDRLISNHDRLVREAARNRSDINFLKEGIGRTAAAVQAHGERLAGPRATPEGHMLSTVVENLYTLGEAPRAQIRQGNDDGILELEMSPPPSSPPPMTELDAEINADLSHFDDGQLRDILEQSIYNDTIDVYMQPIVALPQRRVKMYEVFARLRAGSGIVIPAERYIELAQEKNLLPSLDNLLLVRALDILRKHKSQKDKPLFLFNISATSLADREFMSNLASFLAEKRSMAEQLVFEFRQDDLEIINDDIRPILDNLTKLGCRFSMDRIRKRQINIPLMRSLHIRFMKMDVNWLLKEGQSKSGFSRIVRLRKELSLAGIDLIAEKIETESQARDLLDYSIDYGQGYLFAKPDSHIAFKDELKAA